MVIPRAIEVNLRIKTHLDSQSFLYEIVTSTLLGSAKEARYVVQGRMGGHIHIPTPHTQVWLT